ncbi:hypothetical protein TWF694_003700 [Orbilia ellipsospora]|uniref:Ricin B lectin domain-containing protein n=1 Tax=Orbilia ellipsospora TaxID=2528407 RepID=A0AAV9X053_9PEZI
MTRLQPGRYRIENNDDGRILYIGLGAQGDGSDPGDLVSVGLEGNEDSTIWTVELAKEGEYNKEQNEDQPYILKCGNLRVGGVEDDENNLFVFSDEIEDKITEETRVWNIMEVDVEGKEDYYWILADEDTKGWGVSGDEEPAHIWGWSYNRHGSGERMFKFIPV